MSDTYIDAVEAILESVIEETDDADVRFRLRTALQVLVYVDEQFEGAREALTGAEMDDDVRENLRRLGYLD